MKLGQWVEDVVAGTFVVVQGEKHDVFCRITDVEIEAANEQILLNPPDPSEDLLREVMQGAGTYVTVRLKPMPMMPNADHPALTDEEPKPVKTIPAHFSPVAQAEADDVVRVFGDETPFGKIAWEMRTFFVSLLVVDQRPSAIDEEVLSQIGTKMLVELSDEKDIGAALVGTSDASSLRELLASLDAKQQALLLGHTVPMPIVVKRRTYDRDFYEAFHNHPATHGFPSGGTDPGEKMDGLFH